MQPDREDAERDDAAVEVAAHVFFVSLSRGASAAVAAVVKTWRRFCSVLKAWCCVAFLAQLMVNPTIISVTENLSPVKYGEFSNVLSIASNPF